MKQRIAIDLADAEDPVYTAQATDSLPDKVDLALPDWPAWNQGGFQDCTAHVVAGAIEILLNRRDGVRFEPSRAFIFYNGRVVYVRDHDPNGSVSRDAPVYLKDDIKGVVQNGVCAEDAWKDPVIDPGYVSEPSAAAYEAARRLPGLRYFTLAPPGKPRDLAAMKACLAAGQPIGMGFWKRKGYDTSNGHLPDPSGPKRDTHAVLLTGFDRNRFRFRNSEGSHWGEQGYGTMPYAYALDPNNSFSLWAMRLERNVMSNDTGQIPPPGGPNGFNSATYTNTSGQTDGATLFAFPSPLVSSDVPAMVPLDPIAVQHEKQGGPFPSFPNGGTWTTVYQNQICPWENYPCNGEPEVLDDKRNFMIWVWHDQTKVWLCFHWEANESSEPGHSIKSIDAAHISLNEMQISVQATNGETFVGPTLVTQIPPQSGWFYPPWGGQALAGFAGS